MMMVLKIELVTFVKLIYMIQILKIMICIFPFLEAQLLWSLKIPSKISFADLNSRARANMLLNREYGPVCRLCNCNPHKGGKNILRFDGATTQINTDTIDAIVKDSTKSSGWTKGRPRPVRMGQTKNIKCRRAYRCDI